MGTKRSLGPYCWPFVSAQKTNFRRSAALLVFSGRITYVKVQIGYADRCELGGFTIEIAFDDGTLLTVAAAALMPTLPGRMYRPAAFWTAANGRWFLIAYATST